MFSNDSIRHIFFDLDNTLWDHRGNSEITLRQMFIDYKVSEKYNLDFDEWHVQFYEKNEYLWAELREGHITKLQLRERRFAEPFAHFNVLDDELSKSFEDNYLKKMGQMQGYIKGADELLAYLHPKYTIHVITNGFEEVSQSKLDNSGLSKFITTLTCADEIDVRKPDPRIFELAASKANASKDESLIVGDDWIADVIGGTGFGWKAIFFDTLNDGNQLDKVPSVTDLVEIIDLL